MAIGRVVLTVVILAALQAACSAAAAKSAGRLHKVFHSVSRAETEADADAHADAAWDQAYYKEVHPAVVRMAQKFMTPKALAQARALVGADLPSQAGWADRIVFTPPEQKWSSPMHFINLPDNACAYQRARDCANNVCVDGAIQNYTARLVDTKLGNDQRAEALKFLFHFLGDIHQPLHVANAGDWGGNKITGKFLEETEVRNLHAIWDASIPMRAVRDNYKGDPILWTTKMAARVTKSNIAKWQQCANARAYPDGQCSDAWANESAALACKFAYKDSKGVKLANNFVITAESQKTAAAIIETALMKAAVRLAGILNKIFK